MFFNDLGPIFLKFHVPSIASKRDIELRSITNGFLKLRRTLSSVFQLLHVTWVAHETLRMVDERSRANP